MRRATVAALERGAEGIYNIADDECAEVSEWRPALAAAIGARLPYLIPAWMGRFAIGESGIVIMNEVRGVSNAKAKRELGWKPVWSSWRQWFQKGPAA